MHRRHRLWIARPLAGSSSCLPGQLQPLTNVAHRDLCIHAIFDINPTIYQVVQLTVAAEFLEVCHIRPKLQPRRCKGCNCCCQVKIRLDANKAHILEGASECAAENVSSSLEPQNARVSAWVDSPEEAIQHQIWPMLVDPQTGESTPERPMILSLSGNTLA